MSTTIKLFIRGIFEDKKKTVLLAITALVGIIYIVWRFIFVMSWNEGPYSLTWGLILYMADLYGFVTFLIFSFETWNIKDNVHRRNFPKKDDSYTPTVDIFICTYNEPPEVVRKTAIAAKVIRYKKKKIYILDDGKRPEIQQIAKEIGVNYITRKDNEHYKAGNINNALKYTDGELIVNFDADHVPNEYFLSDLVYFFREPKVALVQTPQHFFNPDPFQRNLKAEAFINNEQDLFFRVVQPGLSYWNAIICCGTNFVIRRSALLEIGGIPTETVTEDMHTSIRLQEKGYKTFYFNRPLAAGLAAESFSEYLQQRRRWAKGCLQIFFSPELNPLFSKGLNIGQKICYLGALNYYFLGIPRLIYLLAPSIYILFNLHACVATLDQLLLYQIPYLFFMISSFLYISSGMRKPIITDAYETVISFDLTIVALHTMIFPTKRLPFRVTQKSLQFDKPFIDLMSLLPELTIFSVLIVSILLVPVCFIYNLRQDEALIINTAWLIYNFFVIVLAIKAGTERPQRRKYTRIPVSRTYELIHNDKPFLVNSIDLSEGGALLKSTSCDFNIPAGSDVFFTCYSKFETVYIRSTIVGFHKNSEGNCLIRLKFGNLSKKEEEVIITEMFSYRNRWK